MRRETPVLLGDPRSDGMNGTILEANTDRRKRF
jgi:hypothetical protein